MDFLSRETIGDQLRRAPWIRGQLLRGHQQHSFGRNELELFRVVVAPARDDDAPGIQPRYVECAPQRAAARPASAARVVAQVRVRIDPQHSQAGVAFGLGGKRCDRRAVVAAEHGEQRSRWNARQLLRGFRPAGLDVGSGVHVAHVVDMHSGEKLSVLGHRRHGCGKAPDPLRSEGRAFAVYS